MSVVDLFQRAVWRVRKKRHALALVTILLATLGVGAPTNAADITTTNWWPGNGNANDVIGNRHGTLLNGTTFATGNLGQAFSFDGLNDHVSFGNVAGNVGSDDFTLAFWIKTTSSGRHEGLIGKRPSCAHGSMFDMRLDPGGKVYVEIDGSSGGLNYNFLITTTSVNDGRFHHVALVRKGTSASLYIDGRVNVTKSTSGITNVSNTVDLTAGKSRCTGVDNTQHFKGVLDEIVIGPDRDTDSRPDVVDNCPAVANGMQEDADADGFGDACDSAPPSVSNLAPAEGASLATSTPTLSATFEDPDVGDDGYVQFEVYQGGSPVASNTGAAQSPVQPGQTATWRVPDGALRTGAYTWRARAFDGVNYSPWTSNPANRAISIGGAGLSVVQWSTDDVTGRVDYSFRSTASGLNAAGDVAGPCYQIECSWRVEARYSDGALEKGLGTIASGTLPASTSSMDESSSGVLAGEVTHIKNVVEAVTCLGCSQARAVYDSGWVKVADPYTSGDVSFTISGLEHDAGSGSTMYDLGVSARGAGQVRGPCEEKPCQWKIEARRDNGTTTQLAAEQLPSGTWTVGRSVTGTTPGPVTHLRATLTSMCGVGNAYSCSDPWETYTTGWIRSNAAASGTASPCDRATISWDGGANTTSWSSATNWTGDRLPNADDHVCIAAVSPGASVTHSSTTTVKSVEARKPLTLNGSLTLTSTTVPSVMTAGTINATLNGPGELQIDGNVEWSGGSMNGFGTTWILNGSRLNVPYQGCCSNRGVGSNYTLINDGTLSVDGGEGLSFGENFHLQNNGRLEWAPTHYSEIYDTSASGTTKPLITNSGTIVKTTGGDKLITVPVWNKSGGVMRSDFGTLRLEGGSSGNPHSGTFAGGVVLWGGAPVSGATFTGTNNTVAGVTLLQGTTSTVASGSTNLAGSLNGPGRLLVQGTLNWTGGEMHNFGSTYVASEGRLNVTYQDCCSNRAIGSNYTIVNDGTMAIAGGEGLSIGDAFEIYNNGTLEWDPTHYSEIYDTSTTTQPLIANAGTFVKKGGYDRPIFVPFENDGTIQVDAGALTLNGRFRSYLRTRSLLSQGEYVLKGALRVPGLNVIRNAARITLDGSTAGLTDQYGNNALGGLARNAGGGRLTLKNGATVTTGALRNMGKVTVEAGSTLTTSGYTQTRGATVVDASNSTLGVGTTTGMNVVGGSLRGNGVVQGNVTNSGGAIMPGATTSPGLLTIQGSFTQTSGGTLDLDIAGAGSSDALAVTGAASLGGRLSVLSAAVYSPIVGDTFTLLTYASQGGSFASTAGTSLPGGLAYSIQLQPQSATAVVQ